MVVYDPTCSHEVGNGSGICENHGRRTNGRFCREDLGICDSGEGPGAGNLMIFTDAFERGIDDKHRIQIPAPYRHALESGRHGSALYVAPGQRANTLSFYPEKFFEEKATALCTHEIPGDEALDFEQMFFSLASRVELDKQGRVVLPERQLAMVDLGKDVCIAGADYRFDIWRKSAYEIYMGDAAKQRSALHSFMRGRGKRTLENKMT